MEMDGYWSSTECWQGHFSMSRHSMMDKAKQSSVVQYKKVEMIDSERQLTVQYHAF